MANHAELEIALRRGVGGAYGCEFWFRGANSDSREHESDSVRIDLEGLKSKAGDEYGKALSESLFKSDVAKEVFHRAEAAAEAEGAPLRLRLRIHKDAPELHSVRWEMLRGTKGEELLNGANWWFSRYLASERWRPVRRRHKADMKALLMIANPVQLQFTDLPPVPVERVREWAELSLAGHETSRLISSGEAGPEAKPTMENLVKRLRDGVDILILICHGELEKNMAGEMVPYLWLDRAKDDGGKVDGLQLVAALKRMRSVPCLIVLASCESSGTGASEDALEALGPKLLAAGVPAVIAMQGKVKMETIDVFMPTFFTELQRDGQIDRAMAVARGDAYSKNRRDYWMPVLFLRLESGGLWRRDREKAKGVLWLLLPTALLLTLVAASLYLRVPAKVEIEARTNQVKLRTVGGSAQVLLNQFSAGAVGLSGFKEVSFNRGRIWIANPARQNFKDGSYAEDAWEEASKLVAKDEVPLEAMPEDSQLIRIRPWPQPGSATDSVEIGQLEVKGDTTVTLSTPDGEHALHVSLPKSSERSSLRLPKRFQMHVSGVKVTEAFPYGSPIDLRVELQEENGLLSYTPSDRGTKIVAEDLDTMSLDLGGNGLKVQKVEFVRPILNSLGMKSSLVGEGRIHFERNLKPVDLAAKDILELNQLEDFRLASAQIEKREWSSVMNLKLRGKAGGLRSGPTGASKDRRPTLFEMMIQDRRGVAVIVAIFALLVPTVVAGRNYWKRR